MAVQHSLRIQGAELEAALSIQDDAALLVGRRRAAVRGWLVAIMAIGCFAILGGGYFMLHQPLVRRAQAQAAAISETQSQHATQLAALRVQWQAERGGLRDELQRARVQANEASTAEATARQQNAVYEAQLAAATAVAEETRPSAAPTRARSAARKPQATRARAKPRAEQAATATRSAATPPRSKRAAVGVDASDDPIGGLEGM